MSNSATRKPTECLKRPKGISSSIKPAPSDEFDKLLSKNVPHIHEGIFFSLDYESFVACRKVSRDQEPVSSSDKPIRVTSACHARHFHVVAHMQWWAFAEIK